MAAAVANSSYLAFGSNGSTDTEVDRSTYFENFNFPREMEEVETTTFGNSGNRTFIAGLKGATISGDGNWDATIDGHLAPIFDGQDEVEFEYGPAGNGSGAVKYSGSMFLTSYEISPAVGEKIPFSASFRISTAVTRGTFS